MLVQCESAVHPSKEVTVARVWGSWLLCGSDQLGAERENAGAERTFSFLFSQETQPVDGATHTRGRFHSSVKIPLKLPPRCAQSCVS